MPHALTPCSAAVLRRGASPPRSAGMFFDMYRAVQPRLVTEFVYRHAPQQPDALVYMSVEAQEHDMGAGNTFSQDVVSSLEPLGVYALDITGDELGKSHAKHLAGGRAGDISGERIIRFEFPENAGALMVSHAAQSHAAQSHATQSHAAQRLDSARRHRACP